MRAGQTDSPPRHAATSLKEPDLELTFLGTSAGVPTRARNVSCLALRLPQRAETWLFDCGEATQHQLLRSDLKVSQISRVFITHLHGDHLYGLPGLLASLGLSGDVRRLDVYGPSGLDDYLRAALGFSYTRLPYPLAVHQVSAGLLLDDGGFRVRCTPLVHRVPAFGYRVEEHDRPGSFDATRAAELGIPPGPLYGRLKRGETVTLEDGRQIDGAGFSGPPERGRSLAYCTDTMYAENSIELARSVDLLIHEATFSEQDAELAHLSSHATAAEAARVARAAGVGRLALTHISARYSAGGPAGEAQLLSEARAIFPRTVLAADFLRLEISRHRGGALVSSGQ